jgi:hypothetical protein
MTTLHENVKETSTSTGTGDLTLAGAVTGATTFSSSVALGDFFYYKIFQDPFWEIGEGHLSGSTTLVRDAVISSSNSDDFVNFPSGAKQVSITIPDVASDNFYSLLYFGPGSDGDVSISAGTTTLTDTINCRNLTISGTGSLAPNGNIVRVSGILDLTAAPAGALSTQGATGSNSTGNTGGQQGTAATNGLLAANLSQGSNGGSGNAVASSVFDISPYYMHLGGRGGAGGKSLTAASRATNTIDPAPVFRPITTHMILAHGSSGSANNPSSKGWSGGGGATGGSGGSSAGGGGGGAGGAIMAVYARIINRDSTTTTAGAINLNGGNGGNGHTTTTSNGHGGGGGGGGGGGFLYLCYEALLGTSKTGLIVANGGTGGNGGNGLGTGTGGDGGVGGGAGRVVKIPLASGLSIDSGVGASGTTGGVGAVNTGGTGGAGGTASVNL